MEHKYYWPAEWEKHEATWVAWPHNQGTWADNLAEAQSEFVKFVEIISDFETVRVLVGGEARREAANAFAGNKHIEVVDIPTNDAWARDHAPTFVYDRGSNKTVVVDWTFNAWGGKYPPYDDDQRVAANVAKWGGFDYVKPDLVLEGGALEGNGAGILLTTESCALDHNRNGSKSREVIDSILKANLGVDEVVWLPGEPIVGDDTDGHIDQIARFVDEKRIVVSIEKDSNDANYAGLKKNWDTLVRWKNETGRNVELIELPMPTEDVTFMGSRLPAGYANFYIGNGFVLVPSFDQSESDLRACEILRELFPKHTIFPSPAQNLVVGFGAFHCLTQQQPVTRKK